MGREFDRKSIVWRAMLSGNEPLNHQTSLHIETLDLVQRLRIEVIGFGGFRHI